jgi:hypothetical protein
MKLNDWLPDISIFAGLVLLSIGIYMIYIPAMFTILGIAFIYIGWPKGKRVK